MGDGMDGLKAPSPPLDSLKTFFQNERDRVVLPLHQQPGWDLGQERRTIQRLQKTALQNQKHRWWRRWRREWKRRLLRLEVALLHFCFARRNPRPPGSSFFALRHRQQQPSLNPASVPSSPNQASMVGDMMTFSRSIAWCQGCKKATIGLKEPLLNGHIESPTHESTPRSHSDKCSTIISL